jgi:hypothetical protein
MREHLLGDLSRHRDLYYTRSSKELDLAGKNDEVEREKHIFSFHSTVAYVAFTLAGDLLSCAHGWDHEVPRTNCNLFCLALGNDASLAAPKPKLIWVELLALL